MGFQLCYFLFLFLCIYLFLSFLQSDDDCCNSCEEVREAYRKKGWGLTNVDLIDQVGMKMRVILSE